MKSDEIGKSVALREIENLQMDWPDGEVEMDRSKHKQFDPGGWRSDAPHAE